MAEQHNIPDNPVYNYMLALLRDLECEDAGDTARLRDLLGGRDSLAEEGVPDGALRRICAQYEQDAYHQSLWPDFRGLQALYRLSPDDDWLVGLWQRALLQSARFAGHLEPEEQLQVLQAVQDLAARGLADPARYYEMLRDLADSGLCAQVVVPVIGILGSLPAEEEAFATAAEDLVNELPYLAISYGDQPEIVAALDAVLQRLLREHSFLQAHRAACLRALAALSACQPLPELERDLAFLRDCADGYPEQLGKLLCHTAVARHRADPQGAQAALQELKSLAAAHKGRDDWAALASLVVECYALMAQHADPAAVPPLLEEIEAYLQDIGFAQALSAQAPPPEQEEPYSANSRLVHAEDQQFALVPVHYCNLLFSLLRRGDALQPLALPRLKQLQQRLGGIFTACLNRHLIWLDYPQLLQAATETFADFEHQEQLLHAIAYEMADEPLHGDLSRADCEQCLQFMRDCMERFPRQHSFFGGLVNAAQGLALHRLRAGQPVEELLQELRDRLERIHQNPQLNRYDRQDLLQRYLDCCLALSMAMEGEAAIALMQQAAAYRSTLPPSPYDNFLGMDDLALCWDHLSRKHKDAAVREAAKGQLTEINSSGGST